MSKILKCHPGIGDKTEGMFYVPTIIFLLVMILIELKVSFRPQHKLFGKSYKNKILVLMNLRRCGFCMDVI